jgi:hypothetical protein
MRRFRYRCRRGPGLQKSLVKERLVELWCFLFLAVSPFGLFVFSTCKSTLVSSLINRLTCALLAII